MHYVFKHYVRIEGWRRCDALPNFSSVMTSFYRTRSEFRGVSIMQFSRYCFLNWIVYRAPKLTQVHVCGLVCLRLAPRPSPVSLNAKMKFTFNEIFMAFCMFLYSLAVQFSVECDRFAFLCAVTRSALSYRAFSSKLKCLYLRSIVEWLGVATKMHHEAFSQSSHWIALPDSVGCVLCMQPMLRRKNHK